MNIDIANRYAKGVAVSEMEHSGYKASIMAAAKLKDNGHVHALPPGHAIPVVPIHCLPGCPDSWVRESGSYVVPVTPDIGLWFDWTKNSEFTTAIVPSLKGMNPITGQKLDGCQMEQYRDVCPIHKIPFAHGRYCEDCKYSWSPQNYVGGGATTLWLDGFFQSDGTVRQFFYTEDEQRDVATALIGKPNTMPAFGFAFFKYKHERPVETYRVRAALIPKFYTTYSNDSDVLYKSEVSHIGLTKGGSTSFKKKYATKGGGSSTGEFYDSDDIRCQVVNCSAPGGADSPSNYGWQNRVCDQASEAKLYSADHINVFSEEEGRALRPEMYEREVTKEVSVGAGAAIKQALVVDTRPLADYHPEPQALMRIYFCFEEQFKAIVAKGGVKKLEQQKNGFLQGVPVGG